MKAVGITSGGLDSLVATRLIQRMGLDVVAIHFLCGFEASHLRSRLEGTSPSIPGPIVETGAEAELVDIRSEFMPVLARPVHGYGANLNPCIDCKILMLRKAKEYMEKIQAAFVFTGEVIGQRPKSQRKQALELIAHESGLADRLVRPLSGALLPPTAPEKQGLITRSNLESIQGRTRSRQMELASELGITDYPAPAGGCLLTDPAYAARARDLLGRRADMILKPDDPLLLLVGRHIALPKGGKAVVGRNAQENPVIEQYADTGYLLEASQVSGPVTLVEGSPSSSDLDAAARLTARYGQGRTRAEVEIQVRAPDGTVHSLVVPPDVPAGCSIL
jgi:hypothetical protein